MLHLGPNMDSDSDGAMVPDKRRSKEFQCFHCNKIFGANYTLRQHTKQFHVGEELPVVRMGRKPKTATSSDDHAPRRPTKSSGSRITKFQCELCKKYFAASNTLKRHITRLHANPDLVGVEKSACEIVSTANLSENSSMPQIRRAHNVVMEFDSFADFEDWKKQEEDAVVARFVKSRGDYKKKNGTIIKAFNCHRSGRYKPLQQHKRYVKIQGSCKSGTVCPAALVAKILVTGEVQVSYCSQHRGHELEIAHIGLRKGDREQIAGKLAAGIPFTDVLDSWYVNSCELKMARKNLLTRQDLANICVEFGLNRKEVLHTNDADSVAAWVELTKQDPASKNLVRYIKFQGETGAYDLGIDDFLLVLATDAQLVAARTFCTANCPVCLDSTHGLNSYDFQLTTVMCIDEHGEGLPVAFCYSSRVDAVSMTAFLNVFKASLGSTIDNIILMTDDTEVYSNAWTAVMGQPTHRLLCAWHVDRAWRKNLTKVTGDQSLKKTIYQTLRALLELSDKDQFHQKLDQFLAMAKNDSNTINFAAYFEREYSLRPALWAYSYRIGLKAHHNMHLEAMHRVLKHVHLQGRKVRRLDKSIHALLKYLRTKMSDRLVKLYRGKWNRHIGGIRKRHDASKNLSPDICSCITEDKIYTVIGKNNLVYTVRQSDPVLHHYSTCALKCNECKVCVHSFSCSCLDSGLRQTICKHIHLVVTTFNPLIENVTTNQSEILPNCSEEQAIESAIEYSSHDVCEVEVLGHQVVPQIAESQAIFNCLESQHADINVERHLEIFDSTCSFLRSTMIRNPQVAEMTSNHLVRLKALQLAMINKPQVAEQPRLPVVQVLEPANKKVRAQRAFRSLFRSKKRNAQVSVCRPSAQESEFLLQSLGGNVPIVSTQPSVEHDYACDTRSQVINFEHSYSSKD